MISTTNFKARLVEIPKVRKDPEDPKSELVLHGTFTRDKKYRVYAIYTEPKFTDILVADDKGIFTWISIGIFREIK